MRIDIITVVPEMLHDFMNLSILGRAQKKGLVEIHVHNLRDYTKDKHRRVDDYPFGGFAGMVMQCQPIAANLCCSSLSRSLFLRIFFTQNSLFVFGILQHSELSIIHCPLSISGNATPCPCQKHPFTKTHVLYFLNTKSG